MKTYVITMGAQMRTSKTYVVYATTIQEALNQIPGWPTDFHVDYIYSE